MTTWVEQTYKHPEAVVSASQGSYQTLPNGNVVLGYGFNGVVSEFDSNGTILCDAYFQPSSRFTSGDVQSYKNLKFNWTGWPNTDPTMALEDDHLWVSWMGATEVRSWMFEDSFNGEKDWRRNDLVMKKGFETSFNLADRDVRRYVRAVALDDFQLLAGFGFLPICSGALVAWMTWGHRGAWRTVSQEDDEERDIEENDNMNKVAFNTRGDHGFGSKNVGSALWERIPKPKWWKGGSGRSHDVEGGGEMLSDFELSDSEERY